MGIIMHMLAIHTALCFIIPGVIVIAIFIFCSA